MVPVVPAAGQLEQSFPLLSSVLEANAELVHKIHVAVYVSHAAVTKIIAKTQPSQRDQNYHNAVLPK
jgi:hypothetical protein